MIMGAVSSRVTFVLRSAEAHPSYQDLITNKNINDPIRFGVLTEKEDYSSFKDTTPKPVGSFIPLYYDDSGNAKSLGVKTPQCPV
jgi:hypothetical protein